MHTHTIRDLNVLESSATRLEVQHTAQKALQEDDLHAIATLDRLCCSVLQRVAACCSVLQRVAACYSVLKRVTALQWKDLHAIATLDGLCCFLLQCVALCCIVLQCFAVCCSTAMGGFPRRCDAR